MCVCVFVFFLCFFPFFFGCPQLLITSTASNTAANQQEPQYYLLFSLLLLLLWIFICSTYFYTSFSVCVCLCACGCTLPTCCLCGRRSLSICRKCSKHHLIDVETTELPAFSLPFSLPPSLFFSFSPSSLTRCLCLTHVEWVFLSDSPLVFLFLRPMAILISTRHTGCHCWQLPDWSNGRPLLNWCQSFSSPSRCTLSNSHLLVPFPFLSLSLPLCKSVGLCALHNAFNWLMDVIKLILIRMCHTHTHAHT